MELAPYWLVPHPDLSLDRYLAMGPPALLHNLALSLATGEMEEDEPFEVALGARTILRWGNRQALRAPLDTCHGALRQKVEARTTWISDRLATMDLTDLEKAKAEAEKAWDQAFPAARAEAERQQESCMTLLMERRGLALDLAGGGALQVPYMNASLASPRQAGLWLTPAWLGRTLAVSGLAGAFSSWNSEGDMDPFLRVGAQLQVSQARFAVAPEGRLDLHPFSEDRIQGQAGLGTDVQVAPGFWVTSTLTLDLPLDAEESFGSRLGFRYGSGPVRNLTPPLAPQTPGT